MQIVLKLGMLTIEEIETELMNNFQFLKLRNRNLWRDFLNFPYFTGFLAP